ncbi:CMP-2-keto-3-deoxyoctulosonic acid synthetase [Eggerthellaceae bacterium zg-1084]|uniref:CMP-2-keto-3-deoxyoctulosonic acid synthetase n=1 Tax=Berryella wangjianweii TaxID=2734634 RepID=A0A6M8J2C5_9ACTN|nr:CMP-2-keto-3-deoxyoctulosonic acid synthetase [Berryella wangjianweii]NPD31635.1 CMP-2-keto-3-deoxyoctulosonic acid synthetase [Berryella wangjianweii]QKF07747.1 CMP-2-keto-3-deoxyoctulosonic acid synthetase [Berryella wangjianweii]
MKRKNRQHPAMKALAGLVVVAGLVGGIGLGVASANNGSSQADTFGIDRAARAQGSSANAFATQATDTLYTSSALQGTAPRSIAVGIDAIEQEERAAAEAERVAREAENAAAVSRARTAQARQGLDGTSMGLAGVDFSVGHDAFVQEWSVRIDSFLQGSPLAGYGATFAEAAWDNGVDPRWSPAISNTESSRGSVCFLPYNAWGWGASSWTSWDEAIRVHVEGLARGYGYTISPSNAARYCPPNADHWFDSTLSSMKRI